MKSINIKVEKGAFRAERLLKLTFINQIDSDDCNKN